MRLISRALTTLLFVVVVVAALAVTMPAAYGASALPKSATYSVTLTGEAGVGTGRTPFNVTATLILRPSPNRGGRAANPIEIGIKTGPSPIVGSAGALWFATNTSLSGEVATSSRVAASAIPVATVTTSGGKVDAVVKGNANGGGVARIGYLNIYNVQSSVVVQIHNVLGGRVQLEVGNDGRIRGRVQLVGSSGSGGPAPNSHYNATLSGSRRS